jgi:hypothetical protein
VHTERQSIDQFQAALLDFLRCQEYDGLSVIIIRDVEGDQRQITNCPNATGAACLLFDGIGSLVDYYRGLK